MISENNQTSQLDQVRRSNRLLTQAWIKMRRRMRLEACPVSVNHMRVFNAKVERTQKSITSRTPQRTGSSRTSLR